MSNFNAMKATVNSNMSNVRRLEELQGFQKIYAPFDGVITARNTDIGALDQFGGKCDGARTLPPCGNQHIAGFYRGAATLFAGGTFWRDRDPDP